jgi:hypothetical protein
MFGLAADEVSFASPSVKREMTSWLGPIADSIPLGNSTYYVIGTKVAFSDAWFVPFVPFVQGSKSLQTFHGASGIFRERPPALRRDRSRPGITAAVNCHSERSA